MSHAFPNKCSFIVFRYQSRFAFKTYGTGHFDMNSFEGFINSFHLNKSEASRTSHEAFDRKKHLSGVHHELCITF